ncbi:MFS general substrate transporter [Pholiota molesta]|nr:MFS general substrate transporter [Pholiota molesta]
MADSEKRSGYNSGTESDNGSSQGVAIYERPKGIKGVYYNPITQVVMLGFVCFMCPGLFNALTGLGGGGQVDATTASNANATLYATFAAGAFSLVNNKIGSRLTLLLGTTGYSLYIGSFLALNIHPHAGAFSIASGAILGICAGLLWTAQGSIMLSYATEDQKGLFIGIFWAIFNLGAVVGASVSLGQNFHSKANAVGNGTYIGFLILTLIGVTIPIFMADPDKMIRTDGTKVTTPRHPSWKVEIYGLYLTLRTDPMVILLFPMFLASNWFYTWQFNEYNQALFNIRARSLNNLVYWLAQIVGSLSIGFLLDQRFISRRVRAFSAWGILLVMVFVVHTWAFFYQKQYTRASLPPDAPKFDIFEHGYTGRILVYIFCGLLDAMWQTTAYWIIGAMSNDPAKLAYFAGFYKSIQSAGGAGSWAADGRETPYMNMFISTWVILVAGLVFALL